MRGIRAMTRQKLGQIGRIEESKQHHELALRKARTPKSEADRNPALAARRNQLRALIDRIVNLGIAAKREHQFERESRVTDGKMGTR